MVVKIFVLGRPGSGKSAAVRCISAFARNYGWLPIFINDYEILQEMFRAEELLQFNTKQRKFLPTEHGGFEVRDFAVLDNALREIETLAHEYMLCVRNFLLIEFARDDYREALKQLSQSLLEDGYFLFINSDMEACIERIYKRTTHPTAPDDGYISNEVMRSYYQVDNRSFMISDFAKEYSIYEEKVKVIDNMGTLKDFHKKIYEFAETILEQETYILRETEPMPELSSLDTEAYRSNLAM